MSDNAKSKNSLRTKTLAKRPPSFKLRKTDLKSTEEAKQIMEVQGSHRTLLCRQPLKKQVTSYLTVDLESSRKKVSFETEADVERKGLKEKPSVVITLPIKSEKQATKGTQTDFRESEAQTLPWKHEIGSGGKVLSDLLSLDWFSSEKNFPPGMDEILQIERARQKVAWEDVIEKLRGRENEIKRRSLVLRIAANETALRERIKDEENRERLDMCILQMREFLREFDEKLQTRLQKTYGCRKRENLSKISYWNHQLTRKIRKAKSARERPAAKPDIIAMHKDRTSDLYAPKLRNGKSASLRHEVIDIRCRYLKRFHGLEILEKHMASVLDPKLYKSVDECLKTKSKKVEASWRKSTGNVAVTPKEKKLASLSLKIALPASTSDLPVTSTAKLRSYSEESASSALGEKESLSLSDTDFFEATPQ